MNGWFLFFFDVMNRLLDWSMTLIFCWVTNTQKKCWIENLSVVHLYHELRLPRLGWIWQPIVEIRLYGSLTLLKINLLIFKALGFFSFLDFDHKTLYRACNNVHVFKNKSIFWPWRMTGAKILLVKSQKIPGAFF